LNPSGSECGERSRRGTKAKKGYFQGKSMGESKVAEKGQGLGGGSGEGVVMFWERK
jgi:hypothetical protein